jgi:hypothetical protein
MIQFPCVCDHLFTVEDDQTGVDIQCPDCGRLNTVPTAADLAVLDGDGTYKVDGPVTPEQPNPENEANLQRIYRHSRLDEFGQEIDLRSHATPLDYARVGVDPIDMLPEGKGPAAPKYDPETGELVRPIEVIKTPAATVRTALPAPRRPSKRRAYESLTRVQPIGIFLALFKPTNLVVMSIIVLGHLIYGLMGAIMMFGIFIIFVGPVLLFLALISHFGNVIDETGPSGLDELPRPLRNVSWHDDLWGPFSAILISVIYCYGIAVVMPFTGIPMKLAMTISAVAAILGTIVAPAVLLTATTSGSVANLRPDRVFGTIRAIGGTYLLLLGVTIIAVPTYVMGFTGLNLWIGQLFVFEDLKLPQPFFAKLQWAVPLMLGGIFLMHWLAWMLGQAYRVYHRYLPWAYQGPLHVEETPGPRGFAVIAPKKRPPASGPLPAIPLKAGPARDR